MTLPVSALNAASNLVSGRSRPAFVVSGQAGFAGRPVFVRSRATRLHAGEHTVMLMGPTARRFDAQ